jgi:hypothetical protein
MIFAYCMHDDSFEIAGSTLQLGVTVNYVHDGTGSMQLYPTTMTVEFATGATAGQINTAIENKIRAFALENFGMNLPLSELIYKKVSRG